MAASGRNRWRGRANAFRLSSDFKSRRCPLPRPWLTREQDCKPSCARQRPRCNIWSTQFGTKRSRGWREKHRYRNRVAFAMSRNTTMPHCLGTWQGVLLPVPPAQGVHSCKVEPSGTDKDSGWIVVLEEVPGCDHVPGIIGPGTPLLAPPCTLLAPECQGPCTLETLSLWARLSRLHGKSLALTSAAGKMLVSCIGCRIEGTRRRRQRGLRSWRAS